ncbi:hypothetical protein BCR36DRAFT_583722 [Piromyces finnis]|uniref:Coth-domain-containing protein n=1 Tax=Piromyces finnis TaxID=1754191 RepID=A0A1Y1V8H4_9FUNG|nr:hypothetical protein BCR36DRAFT_583722 [Piromyces finnis]|eukprot:ORX49652.1 hypothetical protein BCR36DRAFT_583722 [Piromyces finnis]
MYKNILLLLVLCVSSALCRTVTFKIISFGSKVQVKINKSKYTLKPLNNDEILYAGKLSTAPEGKFNYHYIVDGKEENFNRVFDANASTTYIEFFERKDTVKKLKTFSYPNNNWNRSIGKTELFDDSYIPTIHITGKTADELFTKPQNKYYTLEKVTFYFKNSKKVVTNVKANPKNKNFAKFQIKMNINSKNNVYGRYLLKLRNGGEDPTNLRQFIYGNIIQALGMPSIHSNMVRVYYNKKPVGFYTLQEEAYSDSFIRAEFYGNSTTQAINAPSKLGYALDGSCGADFEYHPDDMTYYWPFAEKSGESKDRLVALCGAISKLNVNSSSAVKKFEQQWFDIDTFHKAMAMEYLTGDWDGYWYATSNFAVYDDPNQSTKNTYKFYFITQDHDETFGVGLCPPHNTVGYNFPKISYTTMLNREWHVVPDDADHRTLVDKFIAGSPALQKRFQNTLISIVQNIFNPVAFRNVVSSYYNRYQPEMKWDFSFKRSYTPSAAAAAGSPNYTYNDFETNMEKKVGGLEWGLYEWVSLRAEAIKKEFCITWNGDSNPPKKSCKPANNL